MSAYLKSVPNILLIFKNKEGPSPWKALPPGTVQLFTYTYIFIEHNFQTSHKGSQCLACLEV